MRIRYYTYLSLSILSAIALVIYALYTREQFYPVILFLVSSKISFIINVNLIIATGILIGKAITSIFLGNLRDVELETLMESGKYAITETCLAFTIFRNEFTYPIIGLFVLLLIMKSFHWLCKSRIEYMDQVMPTSTILHIKMTCFLLLLTMSDILLTYLCVDYILQHGRSSIILFGFEFGLLCISILNLFTRFILLLLDQNMTNGLTSKGLFVMVVDLICDALKFMTYISFFGLVFMYYGMPFHIMREVFMAFHNFQRKLLSFIKYLKLSKNLEQALESATDDEIQKAGDCLICREPMVTGKKLSCSHVFHLDCLRMWLQHQQSCPLCRADITFTATHATTPSTTNANIPPGTPVVEPVRPPGDQMQDRNNRENSEGTTADISSTTTTTNSTTTTTHTMSESHRSVLEYVRRQMPDNYQNTTAASSLSTQSNNISNSSVNHVTSNGMNEIVGSSMNTTTAEISKSTNISESTTTHLSNKDDNSGVDITATETVSNTSISMNASKESDSKAADMKLQRRLYYEQLQSQQQQQQQQQIGQLSSIDKTSVDTIKSMNTATPIATVTVAASSLPVSGFSDKIQIESKVEDVRKVDSLTSNSTTKGIRIVNYKLGTSTSSSTMTLPSTPPHVNTAQSIDTTTFSSMASHPLPNFFYIIREYPEIQTSLLSSSTLLGNETHELSVYKTHSTSSDIVRKIKKETIVFALERYTDIITHETWLRITDGWIPEMLLDVTTTTTSTFTSTNTSINTSMDKSSYHMKQYILPYHQHSKAYHTIQKKIKDTKDKMKTVVDTLIPEPSYTSPTTKMMTSPPITTTTSITESNSNLNILNTLPSMPSPSSVMHTHTEQTSHSTGKTSVHTQQTVADGNQHQTSSFSSESSATIITHHHHHYYHYPPYTSLPTLTPLSSSSSSTLIDPTHTAGDTCTPTEPSTTSTSSGNYSVDGVDNGKKKLSIVTLHHDITRMNQQILHMQQQLLHTQQVYTQLLEQQMNGNNIVDESVLLDRNERLTSQSEEVITKDDEQINGNRTTSNT